MLKSTKIEHFIPPYLSASKSVLVCVMDADGYLLHAGDLFKSYFSLPDNPVFTSFYKLVQVSQVPYFEDIMLEVMGSPYEVFSVIQYHHRGNIQWEFSLLKNAEGDILGIMGIGVIKKEPTPLFANSSENYISDKDVHFQLDQNWEISYLNDAAEHFFGEDRQRLMNRKVWQAFPHSKIYEYALEFKKAREDKRELSFEDFIPELGRWYHIHIDPREAAMDVCFKDISESQLLENELSRLKSSFDAVLEGSEESIILLGHDLSILRFNEKAASQIASCLRREIRVGDKFLQNMLPGIEQKILGQLDLILGGSEIAFEKEIAGDGNDVSKVLLHTISSIRDSAGNLIGFIYANRDIHQDRGLIERLSKTCRDTQEIAYQQSVALRSPLASILGLLELLDKDQLDPENQKYLSYIRILADELDQIIRKNSKKINDSTP